MNNNFFNNRYTLILQDDRYKLIKELNLPTNVDVFTGSLERVSLDIKKHELDLDTFYNGHLIINTPETLTEVNFEDLFNKNIREKTLYVKNVVHSGNPTECTIDDNILLCNGFILPFVANHKRTQNTLYATMWSNRIKIKVL